MKITERRGESMESNIVRRNIDQMTLQVELLCILFISIDMSSRQHFPEGV